MGLELKAVSVIRWQQVLGKARLEYCTLFCYEMCFHKSILGKDWGVYVCVLHRFLNYIFNWKAIEKVKEAMSEWEIHLSESREILNWN